MAFHLDDEWLETDNAGAFAMGTVSGIRTRRYHNICMHAASPSEGRTILVNGYEAWVETNGSKLSLTRQCFRNNLIAPAEAATIENFVHEPWPSWTFADVNGVNITQQLFIRPRTRETFLLWQFAVPPDRRLHFRVRPFIVSRHYHSLRRYTPVLNLSPKHSHRVVVWKPESDGPALFALSDGEYVHEPDWWYDFEYSEERQRGLDYLEDAASPGVFRWTFGESAIAVLVFGALLDSRPAPDKDPLEYAIAARDEERARRAPLTSLTRAADAYLVRRPPGTSLIAGFPWFTDWGRDTFIAMRGLYIWSERIEAAESILFTWAPTVSNGLLPNCFPDGKSAPIYNSIDASLWFIVAVGDFLEQAAADGYAVRPQVRSLLETAVQEILAGYARGTRYNIRLDTDGLIAGGEDGAALTWMDARVDGRGVTPRVGKPVEIQSLWLNALAIASQCFPHNGHVPRWIEHLEIGKRTFLQRFWAPEENHLADVIDVDHVPNTSDRTLRPNQILAVGGLPFATVPMALAQSIFDAVDRTLWTPHGLRTLAPDHLDYHGRYTGGAETRDRAYHQGTAWTWMLGPFMEALLRLNHFSPIAIEKVQHRFLAPLDAALQCAGLGHLSEIADGDPPYTPRGCPFQAWSLGEYLRIKQLCSGQRRVHHNPWRLVE